MTFVFIQELSFVFYNRQIFIRFFLFRNLFFTF